MVRMDSITQVSALFTDLPPPQPIRELLETNAIGLHIAQSE